LTAEGFIVCSKTFAADSSSEGDFVMLRQPRDPKDKNAIDESTDTYDTIDWLLKNVPNNNGNVGIAGTVMGVAVGDGHARSASSAEGCCGTSITADYVVGDDFHHNGAFRLSYGLEYGYMMESGKR
jgi:predicted acyl esterase